MEKINITNVKNTLEEVVYLQNDQNEEIMLQPGDTLEELTGLSIALAENLTEIKPEGIKVFRVGPAQLNYAYAASWDKGLVSAAGVELKDFFPEDPTHLKITDIMAFPGQQIGIHFKTDELADGTVVTWVIGEIDP